MKLSQEENGVNFTDRQHFRNPATREPIDYDRSLSLDRAFCYTTTWNVVAGPGERKTYLVVISIVTRESATD